MSVLDFLNPVKDIVSLVDGIIKDFVADPAKKLELQQKMLDSQTALQMKAMDLQGQLVDAQAKIISAEATGDTLQRDWRPLMMLIFAVLVIYVILWGGTDLQGQEIPQDYVNWMFRIITIGTGGYVAEPVVKAMKGTP